MFGSRDVAAGAQRRAHELARRRAGPAHDVLRRRHPERDVVRRELVANYADPYLSLPGGRVRVNSRFDDGTSGVQMLSFGGSQSLNSASTTTGAQAHEPALVVQHEQQAPPQAHERAALRRRAQDQTTNLLGTFTFNSLADLAAGRPA